MSDEQRKDEEAEVEAHRRRFSGSEEPGDDDAEDNDDDVDAHVMRME